MKPVRYNFVSDKSPPETQWQQEQDYQKALKQWRLSKFTKYETTPLPELTLGTLDALLELDSITKKGSRELKEHRLERYRQGLPVRMNIRTKFDLEVVPQVLILQHRTDYHNMSSCLLSVPRDVIRNHICKKLDVYSLFRFMIVCKQFQSACHGVLTEIAREMLGTKYATPFALSIALYRPIVGMHNDITTARLANIGKMLNLSSSVCTRLINRWDVNETMMLFAKECVRKNGYADNVRVLESMRATSVLGKEAEQSFVEQHIDERIVQINAIAREKGYTAHLITFVKRTSGKPGKKRVSIRNKRIKNILKLFRRYEDIIKSVNAYVLMKDMRTTAKALSSLYGNRGPLILTTALECNVDNIPFLNGLEVNMHSGCMLAPIVEMFNGERGETTRIHFASPTYPESLFVSSLSQIFNEAAFRVYEYTPYVHCGWLLDPVSGAYTLCFVTTGFASSLPNKYKKIEAMFSSLVPIHYLVSDPITSDRTDRPDRTEHERATKKLKS